MKKLYLIFFIFFSLNFYGQTYNFQITYGLLCNTCWEGAPGPTYNSYSSSNFSWSVKNNTATIASNTQNGYVAYGKTETNYFNRAVQNGSNFTVAINSTGTFHTESGLGYTCNTNESKSITVENLILNGSVGYFDSPCGLTARITNFTPNITIKNLDASNPNVICAGFQLSLNAFSTNDTEIFPSAAYHWQYSVDNSTWVDVPNNIGGTQTNNVPTTKFTIQQILGSTHTNYLNKLIYFRLGYLYRPFTQPLEIKYSACAPVIESVSYVGPVCSEDPIQKLEVTFDRPLRTEIGESLDRIKLKDVTTGAESNEHADISTFAGSNLRVYSFTNIQNIQNSHTYKIVYQAKITNPSNQVSLMGFMESTSPNGYLTYTDPPKMKFEITGQKSPSCVGGDDGYVEITITSGSSPYLFYKDNIAVTATYNSINGKYYIYGLKDQIYNFKVTDKNNCIDKTATDSL